MKSFQLSLAFALSLLIIGFTHNPIACQSPAPTTQSAKMEVADKKGDHFGIGNLDRAVDKRVYPKNMGQYTGSIVFNICADPSGNIIFAQYNSKRSTITDEDAIAEALSAMKKTKFEADPLAHNRDCGRWTMKFEGN